MCDGVDVVVDVVGRIVYAVAAVFIVEPVCCQLGAR